MFYVTTFTTTKNKLSKTLEENELQLSLLGKSIHIITDDDDEIPNSLQKAIRAFHIV